MTVEHITAYLQAHPDGVVVQDIARDTHRRLDKVKESLERMRKFAYIDRYQDNNPLRPIWLLVDVPDDCPRPTPKRKAKA